MIEHNAYKRSFLRISLGLGIVFNAIYIFAFLKDWNGTYIVFGAGYFVLIWFIWKMWHYIFESYDELMNKVSWPTWSELQSSSIVVAIASVIIALIIFAMDSVFRFVLDLFYSLFS